MRLALMTGLLVLLAGFCLPAQTIDIEVNIPFDFRLGEVSMPAGEYLVRQSGPLVTLRTVSGPTKKAAMFLTTPTSRRAAQPDAGLLFNKYGSEYFLAAVWSPESRDGGALPKSTQERELISHTKTIETASIPAKRK